MSGGDKVFLFGSFTEDETKLFQGQPVTSSTKSVDKKWEKWELPKIQFGSLNFSVLNLQNASNPIMKGVLHHGTKSTVGQNKVIAKDDACSNKTETVASSVTNGEPVLFNGFPTANDPARNGVLENSNKTNKTGPVAHSAGAVAGVLTAHDPAHNGVLENSNKTNKTGPVAHSAGAVAGVLSAHDPAHNGVFENSNKTNKTGPVAHSAGAVAPLGVPIKNICSSAPLARPEVHHDRMKCTQSSSSVMEITENENMVVDAPIIAVPADEAMTSSNKKVFENKPLLPHGLRNTGNICFLNATLQALLACMPFVQLLQDLRNRSIPKVGYPTLSAFIEFISQFDVLDEPIMNKNDTVVMAAAKALNPAMFDHVLRNFTPDVPAGISARPRQEDAQEFLSFAMDRMHDELLKLNGNGSNSKEGMVVSSADDDAWETVGRKNKSAITRTQSFVPSELSVIFGGQLQSLVKATGNKASATVQPFLLLHLDICSDAVQTLDDALHLFSAPESLEGYRTAAGKAGVVTARKLVKIHTLSKIMILHLKRFSYGNGGSRKIYKPLYFPLNLVLSRDLLILPSSESRRYELVATITHHGNDPSRGHYTADAKCAGGQWLRFDDDVVTPVSVNKVLHDHAYVLFYKQV